MWRKVNILWIAGIIAALSVALTGQAWGDGHGTAADTIGPTTGDDVTSGNGPTDVPLMDATNAQQAALMVEQWLADGKTPTTQQLQAEPVPVRGLLGVCVTLRYSGLMIGRGEALRDDLEHADQPTNLTVLLRQAADRAFDALRESLLDANLRATIEGRGISAPPKLALSDVASRLTVDVQLAHDLEPIRLSPTDKQHRVFSRFAPGYHGLLTRDDQGKTAVIWPANALAENTAPASQLVQLVSQLGLSPLESQKLGRPKGLDLWRFEVYHVVPPVLGETPQLLVRGNRPLQPRALNESSLDELAHSLAEHLSQLFLPDDGTVRGTYHPTSGRYDPPLAEPNQALLASYALTRYVRQQHKLRTEDHLLSNLNRNAQDQAVLLGHAIEDGKLSLAPATAALILLTTVDNSLLPRHTDVRDEMIHRLLQLRQPDGTFRSAAAADAPPVNDAVSTLVVASLAAAYAQTRRDELVEPLRGSMDQLWTRTEGNPNINALPWLAMAQERAGALLADTEDRKAQKQQRDAVLADLVDKLLGQQVVDSPRVGPDDVVGGFELSTGPIDSPPNPNWTTAPLLCFLAVAARQPDIRGNNELGWLLSAALAARFIDQLQFQPDGCYYVRSPMETVGGVRLALWDNRLTLDATAMSLLAVTDLQQTLDEFR